jgi:hypothetical protein
MKIFKALVLIRARLVSSERAMCWRSASLLTASLRPCGSCTWSNSGNRLFGEVGNFLQNKFPLSWRCPRTSALALATKKPKPSQVKHQDHSSGLLPVAQASRLVLGPTLASVRRRLGLQAAKGRLHARQGTLFTKVTDVTGPPLPYVQGLVGHVRQVMEHPSHLSLPYPYPVENGASVGMAAREALVGEFLAEGLRAAWVLAVFFAP